MDVDYDDDGDNQFEPQPYSECLKVRRVFDKRNG
jgi:hypothetical protein